MNLAQPFVRLPFAFDAKRLAAEVSALALNSWMAHPSRINGNSAVPLVSLHGLDNDDFSGPMLATQHLAQCQYTQQVVASFGEVIARSRFMKLAAGSEVTPHVDFNYHWYNRVRIHIPVITNPEVIFYCGDQQRHMQAGECWIFDSWRPHNVINSSQVDRVHLVIDVAGSSQFWQTVSTAIAKQKSALPSNILEHVEGFTPNIRTERFNVSPVMAPGELEAIAQELIADFSACTDNDPRLIQQYSNLLNDLAKDWRQVWLQHGIRSSGFAHYRSLLQNTKNRLQPQPRALVTSSNNVGVNPIIVQRILRAALFEEHKPDFISN